MSETPPSGRRRSITRESGFWHRVRDRKMLQDTDIFRLREDMKRLEDVVERISEDGQSPTLLDELREVQLTVEKDFGAMSLVLQSLIEIMLEKEVMTEDEFEDKMEEIDLRDGRRDGTMSPAENAPASDSTEAPR